MAELRIGRGWKEKELEKYLDRLPVLEQNFSELPEKMTPENGWHRYYSEAVIASVKPGSAKEDRLYQRGCEAIDNYEFSDPRIVIAHFDKSKPLAERHMLLEMRAFHVFHYLAGVAVGEVRSEQNEMQSVYGFRYDTLEGHIERGTEWFLLTKEHETGEIKLCIDASWLPGDFPNLWSRLGFSLVGSHYQERWHRQAHRRMANIIHRAIGDTLYQKQGALVHTDPDVIFKRIDANVDTDN